jgi:hypothetical protein
MVVAMGSLLTLRLRAITGIGWVLGEPRVPFVDGAPP